ncbi:MAG: response regulator [Phycisphaeraceae bacterium]|nr:response regulator [Phycisphaeraceae bacterium]
MTQKQLRCPITQPSVARRILIVEDDFASFKVLQEYLNDYGECCFATDGPDAVAAFKDALKQGRPYDLICLDIMLPNMDGHRALEEIHQIERTHGIPPERSVKVIMTTAIDDSEVIAQAFNEGCKAYLVKPITTDRIYHEMNKLEMIPS